MRQWVIGDIHGCYNTLKSLIENKIKPQQEDSFIFLGDYIDRGNYSKEVIEYLIEFQISYKNTIFLRGNHEEYLLNAYETARIKQKNKSIFSSKNKDLKLFLEVGGKETLTSFKVDNILQIPEKYIIWLKETQYYYITDKYVFVHAGLNLNIDNPLNDKYTMLRIRDFEMSNEKMGDKILIHGHVPLSLDFIKNIINTKNCKVIPLDNGCVYKDNINQGNLLALELNSFNLMIEGSID